MSNYSQSSGYVNVNGYLVTGLNNFTFIDYNGQDYYSWGFELRKNCDIIFSDIQSYNGDTSKAN